jgi:hypothetical protein
MMKRTARIVLVVALGCWGAVAGASVRPGALQREARDPDWPCVQIKVPELSAAAIWSGPPLDLALTRWSEDDEVAALVREIAPRRVPVEDADKAIRAFAEGLAPAVKEEKLLNLFAGLLVTLNRERDDVMAGIDRYGRKQKALAEQIRADQARVSEMSSASTDAQQVNQMNEQLIWSTRIFNERRASLSLVCEVPVIIEQRLFALGRTIQSLLPKS